MGASLEWSGAGAALLEWGEAVGVLLELGGGKY